MNHGLTRDMTSHTQSHEAWQFQFCCLFFLQQSADGELLLWSVGEGGAGIVDGREGRDVTWATHTVTGGRVLCELMTDRTFCNCIFGEFLN